jgi:hypothetical protein
MGAALFDAKGCLTDPGVAMLASAPVGEAPPELAAHVASCGRCQERLLASGEGRAERRERKEPPPAWRVWVVMGGAVLLLLSILVTIRGLR